MDNSEKSCPFLQQKCLKNQCELFNTILNRCDIGVLAYNLYRLSEIEKQRIEASSFTGQDQKTPSSAIGAGHHKRPMGGLFND